MSVQKLLPIARKMGEENFLAYKKYIKTVKAGKDAKEAKPHYLIVTDNFKAIRNYDIIKNILDFEKDNGFSLVILSEKLTNIPDQCKSFVNIYQEKAELYKNTINKENTTIITNSNTQLYKNFGL